MKSETGLKIKEKIKVGIFGNPQKKELDKLLAVITSLLSKYRTGYLIDDSLKEHLAPGNKIHTDTSSSILSKSGIVFSLGGDGTFLNTAKIVGNRNIPILGINLGRLGFFSEIGPGEIKKFIPDLLNGKYKIKEQTIIRAEINKTALFGLNDIVIDKSKSIRMIETITYYNGEKVFKCLSDGIIVSTPAGSTGYSMSCNGPVVNPKSSVFIITPISPHTLNVRPIIIPDDGEIKIKLPHSGEARITADGQKSIPFKSPVEVRMSKADYTIKVVKKVNSTYFNTLTKKLFWNVDKRTYS